MARLHIDKRSRKYRHKSRPNEATNILSLPQEALLEIGTYLNLPDVEALSTTCRRLQEAFAETLGKDQAFARQTLRDLTLTTEDYGYHDFLLQILKREINPNYVKRFDCSHACEHYSRPFDQQDEEIDLSQYIGWTQEDIRIVRRAIARSPWLENIITPDDLIAKMLDGDEEAILVLLIPMLQNLSLFLPPKTTEILPMVFVKIARAQISAETEYPEVLIRLPLRRLHTIYTDLMLGGSVPINDIIRYMSLPSVRCVFISSLWFPGPQHIGWIESRESCNIPRSRASVVYIKSAELWRPDVEVLADYFNGPCTIRQYLGEAMPTVEEENESWVGWRLNENGRVPQDPMSYYWDHCIIIPNQSVDELPTNSPKRGSRYIEGPNGRIVETMIKYRDFHWEDIPRAADFQEYEDAIRQTGTVPSPQWLALAKWEHCLNHPEKLDDDSFMLES